MSAAGSLLLVVLAGAASAERDNLCFTAHSKSSLVCTKPLVDGPIAVYDDGQSPQQARMLHYRGSKLCKERGCKQCMGVGGKWRKCAGAPPMPVAVMGANADWAKPAAISFALALVAVPLVIFTGMGPKRSSGANGSGDSSGTPVGAAAGIVAFLLRFASSWWFPFIAGLATAVNMFTIVFTGATVVLFLAAVLGQPRRWYTSALINAAGATAGTAVLLLLVRERGIEYLNSSFPTLLASPAWAKATGLMTTYGMGGMFLVSCLPIILHPVIVSGILSGLNDATILAIVMGGRTIKYLVMSYVTIHAPSALRFFGIKTSLLEYASNSIAK